MRSLENRTFRNLDDTADLTMDGAGLAPEQIAFILRAAAGCLNGQTDNVLVDRLGAALLAGDPTTATTARLLRFALRQADYRKLSQDHQFTAYGVDQRLGPHIKGETGMPIVLEEAEFKIVHEIVESCDNLKILPVVPFKVQLRESKPDTPAA